jgi:hypothetical protein
MSSTVSSQEELDEDDGNRRSSSQRAQVHRPPDIDVDEASDQEGIERVEDDEDEDEDTTERQVKSDATGEGNRTGTLNTNTGLSQSDLSISSSGSNNPSYRYGNQLGYEGGHYGYPQYSGYVSSDEKSEKTVGGGKRTAPRWNTTATVMLRASSVTEGTEKENSNLHVRGRYSIDVLPVSSRLLSDIQAIERQKLEDDRLQEEQRQLGNGVEPFAVSNGDTTLTNDKLAEGNEDNEPAQLLTASLSYDVEETRCDAKRNSSDTDNINFEPEREADKTDIEERDENGISAAKKRGSLPVITPELYTQIKQSTKSLIIDKTSRSGLSPKFEKFRNENSPLDETKKDMSKDAAQSTDVTPANSQEYDNEGFVTSDHVTS